MKINVDTDKLSLFKDEISRYQLTVQLGRAKYAYIHKLVKRYLDYGIIEITKEIPSRTNKNVIVPYFIISDKGKQFLDLFEKS